MGQCAPSMKDHIHSPPLERKKQEKESEEEEERGGMPLVVGETKALDFTHISRLSKRICIHTK